VLALATRPKAAAPFGRGWGPPAVEDGARGGRARGTHRRPDPRSPAPSLPRARPTSIATCRMRGQSAASTPCSTARSAHSASTFKRSTPRSASPRSRSTCDAVAARTDTRRGRASRWRRTWVRTPRSSSGASAGTRHSRWPARIWAAAGRGRGVSQGGGSVLGAGRPFVWDRQNPARRGILGRRPTQGAALENDPDAAARREAGVAPAAAPPTSPLGGPPPAAPSQTPRASPPAAAPAPRCS
jgi:hypothetical protein